MVADEIKASGTFGAVADTPTPDGGLLGIVINDIPDKKVGGKAFASGFTFGLVGVIAGDTYDVTLIYTPRPGAPAITRKLDFRVFLKNGNAALPEGSLKVKATVAVRQMVHLTLANRIDQLAADPAFTPPA